MASGHLIRGTKGTLEATFAARRMRLANGPAMCLNGRDRQHVPGEEVWLVGERSSSGERRYQFAGFPAVAEPPLPVAQFAQRAASQ